MCIFSRKNKEVGTQCEDCSRKWLSDDKKECENKD